MDRVEEIEDALGKWYGPFWMSNGEHGAGGQGGREDIRFLLEEVKRLRGMEERVNEALKLANENLRLREAGHRLLFAMIGEVEECTPTENPDWEPCDICQARNALREALAANKKSTSPEGEAGGDEE